MERYTLTYDDFKNICYDLYVLVCNNKYDGILCILRGGFFLSYFMSEHTGLPIKYIEVFSYDNELQVNPSIGIKSELEQGNYLLCDDIYDTGSTIKLIKKEYPNINFDIMTLLTKKRIKNLIYSKFIKKDVWVDFFWELL